MSNNVSSDPTFRSLGTRHGYFFSDQEKVQIFKNGIANIKSFLADDNAACKPKSIPELIRAIFDPTTQGQQIEAIREVLRPTYERGDYKISASGTKLLACLAVTQDRECFDRQGNLRVDYTKNVIAQWFSNPNEVLLDESALQNIRLDFDDKDENGDPRILLGKNRLSDVELHHANAVSNHIELNRQAANLGRQEMKFDLSSRPAKTFNPTFTEAVVGDMNGNSVMFLHQLVQLGFAEIPPGKEKIWDQLVEKIKANDVNGFRALLPQALDLKQLDKKLVLLGDLLSDRAFNDWFTLSIIDFLHEQKQEFEIIFSNHDAAFVEYYLANKDKASTVNYVMKPTGFKKSLIRHDVKPNTSLARLNQKLNNDPSLRGEFLSMTGKYIQHLKFIGCGEDQRTLYSHGIINRNMMEDMLEIACKQNVDHDSLSLQEKTEKINAYFTSNALSSLDNFHQVFQESSNPDGSDINPFLLSIWNTGPFIDNSRMPKIPDHKYLNADPPAGVTKAVHGHCVNMRTKFDDEQARLRLYAELEELMNSPNPPSNLQEWISKSLQLFIELGASFAAGQKLGLIFTLFLDKARGLAKSAGNADLEKYINEFFKHCTNFPRSESTWFDNYSSSDPNDVVMQKKRRINPKDPLKAKYLDISNDPEIYTRIKNCFLAAQDDHLARHRASVHELFDVLHKAAGIQGTATQLKLSDITLDNFVTSVAIAQSNAFTDLTKKSAAPAANTTNPHAAMIADTAGSIIHEIHKQAAYKSTLNAAHDMRTYMSLDGSFGGFETDITGSRSIFLA